MLEIVGQKHAGSKYYFDDFSKKNIAILTDIEFYKESPLLSQFIILKNLWTLNILSKLVI